MRKLVITIGALLLAVGVGGVVLYASADGSSQPSRRELHTFLHIGCTHHNHGPKWHQDHGRIFNGKGRSARNDE